MKSIHNVRKQKLKMEVDMDRKATVNNEPTVDLSNIPSLILDHNSFALEDLLRSANSELTVHVIRDRFMEFAETQLLTMNQEKSALLKLEIDVAVIDGDFSHVDRLMNLVRDTKVEELSIFVQTRHFRWYEGVKQTYECYDFPYFILTKSGLQSLALRWCRLMGRLLPTDAGLVAQLGALSSLRKLQLSEVSLSDEDSLYNLASCCPRIEVIKLDSCSFWLKTLKLSKFPQLKEASFVGRRCGLLRSVDLTESKLESFYCETTDLECMMSLDSCSNMRKIHLNNCIMNEPHLFKDLATSFPLLEEAEILTYLKGVNTIKASNYHMTKLKLLCNYTLEKIHIDGPNLELFDYVGAGVDELHVDCPNLRQLRYIGRDDKFPPLHHTKVPNLGFMSLRMMVRQRPIETSWFITLREMFLEQRREYEVNLQLSLFSRMVPVNFNLDEFGAIWNPQQNIVHLGVHILYGGLGRHNNDSSNQFAGPLVDGLIWSIRPTTLTMYSDCDGFVKDLREKLALKAQKESCCELELCNKYWWHNIKDFRFASYVNRTNLKCLEVVLNYSGSPLEDDITAATQLLEMQDSTLN